MLEQMFGLVMKHLDMVGVFVLGTLVQRHGVMGLLSAAKDHVVGVVKAE